MTCNILKVKFSIIAIDCVKVLHLLRVAFYLIILNLNFSVGIVYVSVLPVLNYLMELWELALGNAFSSHWLWLGGQLNKTIDLAAVLRFSSLPLLSNEPGRLSGRRTVLAVVTYCSGRKQCNQMRERHVVWSQGNQAHVFSLLSEESSLKNKQKNRYICIQLTVFFSVPENWTKILLIGILRIGYIFKICCIICNNTCECCL